MEKKIIYIFLIVLFFGCNNDYEFIEVKNDDGQLIERYQRRKEDNKRFGKYEAFDEEGKLIEAANYQNDTLDGKRIIYFENGQPQYIEQYNNCLLYTSPSPRDRTRSRMPSSA